MPEPAVRDKGVVQRVFARQLDGTRVALAMTLSFGLYLGTMSLWTLIGLFGWPTVFVSAVASAWLTRKIVRKTEPMAGTLNVGEVLLLTGIVAAITLTTQNFAYGGRDPTGYNLISDVLVKTGSPYVSGASLPAYSGFATTADGRTTIQFLPFYPILLATAKLLFGGFGQQILHWVLWSTVGIALVSLTRIGCEKASFSGFLATATALFLPLPVLWFAREPVAENLLAFFAVGWMTAAVLYLEGSLSFPILASNAFWPAIVKVEGGALTLAVLILPLLCRRAEKPQWRAATIAAPAIGCASMMVAYGILNSDYLVRHLEFGAESARGLFSIVLPLAAAVMFASLVALKFLKPEWRHLLVCVGTSLVGLGIFAFVTWNYWNIPSGVTTWADFSPTYVSHVWSSYKLLPLLFVGLLFGAISSEDSRARVALMVIAVTAPFFYNAQIALDQPWMMRRFVALTIPALALLFGVAFLQAERNIYTRIAGRTFAIFLAISLTSVAAASLPTSSVNAQVKPELDKLAADLPPDSVLLMEPGWHWQRWGYYLQFNKGITTVPRAEPIDDDGRAALMEPGRPLYLLTSADAPTHPWIESAKFVHIADYVLHQDFYEKVRLTGFVASHQEHIPSARLLTILSSESPPYAEKLTVSLHLYQVIPHNDLLPDELEMAGDH